MKTRMFIAFALLLLALSLVPASGALAAAPAAGALHAPASPEVTFTGRIRSLPNTPGWIGTWKVGGKLVHVTSATLIDQTDFSVRLGAKVQVEGFKQKDGSYNATSIDILG